MFELLHHRLIVSCQSSEGDAFHSPDSKARFALAARDGGAAGIRQAVDSPVIGIQKRSEEDGNAPITPDFESAIALVQAGASAIALDCTARAQRFGALSRLRVPVLADIATEEEAISAAGAGADFVLSTMRGYSAETVKIRVFKPAFITRLSARLSVPVIAEGMIATPAPARTAITRPHELTRSFEQAIQTDTAHCIGIATGDGRAALLAHIAGIVDEGVSEGPVPRAIGDATAGWVDTNSGEVVFANESMAGWTGTVLNEFAGPRRNAIRCGASSMAGALGLDMHGNDAGVLGAVVLASENIL